MNRISRNSKIASALLLTGMFACSLKAVAHPISLTDVIFDVREDHVRVRLGMAAEDLVLHYELKANKQYRIESDKLKEAAGKYREFLESRLQLRTADGKILSTYFQGVNLSKLPDDGVLQTELKDRWLNYHWKFHTPVKPQFITIRQEFGVSQFTHACRHVCGGCCSHASCVHVARWALSPGNTF